MATEPGQTNRIIAKPVRYGETIATVVGLVVLLVLMTFGVHRLFAVGEDFSERVRQGNNEFSTSLVASLSDQQTALVAGAKIYLREHASEIKAALAQPDLVATARSMGTDPVVAIPAGSSRKDQTNPKGSFGLPSFVDAHALPADFRDDDPSDRRGWLLVRQPSDRQTGARSRLECLMIKTGRAFLFIQTRIGNALGPIVPSLTSRSTLERVAEAVGPETGFIPDRSTNEPGIIEGAGWTLDPSDYRNPSVAITPGSIVTRLDMPAE